MPKKIIYKSQANKAEAKIDDDDFKNEIEIEAEQVKRNEGLMPSVTNNSNEKNKIITNPIQDTSSQDISVLNKNNEVEILQFSSDEIMESIQIEDATVEIVGFIDEIDGPKIVGVAQRYRLLKFILNNNSRHRVQIVAWNKEIERIEHNLKPNRIIHIDGAKAKIPKNPTFNNGTLPFELIINSNTLVNNIGFFDINKSFNIGQPKLINFEEVPDNLNSFVSIRGYIKTNFNIFNNTHGYGSITDGSYKLQIQIMEYDQKSHFEKGEYIELKGYIKITNDVFYIEVDNTSDIKLLKENKRLSLAESLKATKPILKRVHTDTYIDIQSISMKLPKQ